MDIYMMWGWKKIFQSVMPKVELTKDISQLAGD